jgi:hypothetical protein
MKRQHVVLRQIVGECDSMLFPIRRNVPYRGTDATALQGGIMIIGKLASDAVRQGNTR